MASKSISGAGAHKAKNAIDALVGDTTFTDRQRNAVQQAALDMLNGLDINSFPGKTVTVTADVFSSTTSPSMTVSVAFT